VLAEVELRSLERDNLRAALQAAKGKIRGPAGAAELLGIKPTTLLARMKKWGVKKPEPSGAK
jgi:transcriptional regulator with GAF, ATPase, and Fis domain